MLVGTNVILDHEPCLGLRETSEMSPDSRGFNRYRVYTIIRNDKEVEFVEDLGLSKYTKIDGFIIPGGYKEDKGGVIVHNVGELRKIADQIYDKGFYWDKKELAQDNNIREKY